MREDLSTPINYKRPLHDWRKLLRLSAINQNFENCDVFFCYQRNAFFESHNLSYGMIWRINVDMHTAALYWLDFWQRKTFRVSHRILITFRDKIELTYIITYQKNESFSK